MIRKELAFVWIASDGRRFLNKSKAIKHEGPLSVENDKKNKAVGQDIVSKWIKKIKGDKK